MATQLKLCFRAIEMRSVIIIRSLDGPVSLKIGHVVFRQSWMLTFRCRPRSESSDVNHGNIH